MGLYDIPACVDKMLEVTGKPKVTLIGYSQGSAQMYYGLAKKQDYFAARVHRFIALGSCIYANTHESYDVFIKEALYYDNQGKYNYFGGDESSVVYGSPGSTGYGLPFGSLTYWN